ncbi:hypothetical protein IQ03_02817, partial [Gemmobacter caeni]
MCELCAIRIGQRMALLVQAGRPAIAAPTSSSVVAASIAALAVRRRASR